MSTLSVIIITDRIGEIIITTTIPVMCGVEMDIGAAVSTMDIKPTLLNVGRVVTRQLLRHDPTHI